MRGKILIGALALVASVGTDAATPLADAVKVEVFAALPFIEGPELSPDGTKLAAKIAVNGKQTLVVQPLFGGKPVGIPEGKSDINWWRWVTDDWLVVGLGDQQQLYGEDYYVTRVISLSADMTKVKQIDWPHSGIEADDVIWYASDGSPRILLSKQTGIESDSNWYPSVFEVDVSTGRLKQVVRSIEGVWDWDADAAGNVRMGILWRDGRKRGILYRGPDGSAIAMDDGDGHMGIYELALPSFTLGKKLFGNDRYDLDGVVTTQTGDDLAGVFLTEKRERIDWLDPELKDLQHGLDETLGPGNAEIISLNRDRSRLLVRVGSPSQAGALYYWDTGQEATMHHIGWYNKELKGRSLSSVKTIEYGARDGTRIEAVLTLPRGAEAKALPLIVMPHGGPGARDSEEYDWWVQYLAEQGYAVIQPNYRGSTGYGTKLHEAGEGQWGLKMQDDLLDAIDWAAKEGIADPKRVCIVGASYGGYAAMRGAQRDGPHYRCAIAYAGVSDLGAMLKYDRNYLGKWAADYWKKQVSDSTAVSPRFHAAEFAAPILIAHGVEDKRVPVKQSRMLVEELKKAGKPYEYVEQKLGDHHFSRAEDRLEFLKALKAFLDKYNPA